MSFTQEEWDEISQGIPSTSEPFLQQYLKGRDNLIDQEQTSRSDTSFRQNLSPIARRACAIVDRIREQEKQTVWNAEAEEALAQSSEHPIFPGMMFMQAKERMEGTRLWRIVRQMPKGALLHAHMDAMVDFEYILGELIKLPGMHMSSDRSLDTPEARELADLQFRYRKQEVTDGNVWSGGHYEPGKFLLLTKVADEFPDGGRQGFLAWLKSRCTLDLTDCHQHHHGIDAIWHKFVRCFGVVATIIHYEPMWRLFLRRLMSLLKADGVNWAELR